MVDGHACSGCAFRDQPWGGLESLSHAVPQWVCGGLVILNDLLTNYILFSGSTFWEGLQRPGHDSQGPILSFGMHFSDSTCVVDFVPVGTTTGLRPGLGSAWCRSVRKTFCWDLEL